MTGTWVYLTGVKSERQAPPISRVLGQKNSLGYEVRENNIQRFPFHCLFWNNEITKQGMTIFFVCLC